MITSWARWTLNQKLGLLLAVLGICALIIGSPYRGSSVTVDTAELARIVERETDHVSVEDLADWIIRGKAGFRLIDLRSGEEYARYHIPGAENVPLTALVGYGLQRNEKVILYSEGGIHSAQAWFFLKAADYGGVYLLRGGLDEWMEKILFPRLPSEGTPGGTVMFEKMKEVSRYFGGTPQSGRAEEQAAVTMTLPKLGAPSASPGGGQATTKKKKEGC